MARHPNAAAQLIIELRNDIRVGYQWAALASTIE
jgi:hypothetical protein